MWGKLEVDHASIWCYKTSTLVNNDMGKNTSRKRVTLKQRFLKFVERHGVVRPRDVIEAGLPQIYLLRGVRDGTLQKIGRGLYALAGAPIDEFISLFEVAQRVPRAVMCLLSALRVHGLTTVLPSEVWIALPRGSWRPGPGSARLHVVFVSPECHTYGVQQHKVAGGVIRVTTPAKTVADCFKFRAKIGLDVAIEALRDAVRQRKATVTQILDAARVCRVARVIQPYVEAIV